MLLLTDYVLFCKFRIFLVQECSSTYHLVLITIMFRIQNTWFNLCCARSVYMSVQFQTK